MSAKPTPGPMEIIDSGASFIVMVGDDGPIATFWGESDCKPTHDEALANARAFVDGMAAMEMLHRIERWVKADAFDGEKLVRIRDILDEAKP